MHGISRLGRSASRLRSILSLLFAILAAATFLRAEQLPDPPESESRMSVVYYDATYLHDLNLADPAQRRRFWDEIHLLASLQGLANREEPRLYLRLLPKPDDFWWELMRSRGRWLSDAEVVQVQSLAELLDHFSDASGGAVVWDERVPATSNLASTIAGADRLVCLRHDPVENSLFSELTSGEGRLNVKKRLLADDGSPLFDGRGTIPGTDLPSTGSAKNDAYRWLIEHYIKTGRSNPLRHGFFLDAFWFECWNVSAPLTHTVSNHDYIIANGGILWDLNVWEDEAPVDDPGQEPGLDLETLKLLMRACHDRTGGTEMIHVAGFTPWAFKYTNFDSPGWKAGGKHGGVATEWRTTEVLTCFNAYLDADALGLNAMVNASFFQHYPLPDFIPQGPKPTKESLIEQGILDKDGYIVPRNYYAHYAGDWDAAAWLYQKMPEFWTDPARGQVPITWPFNPVLAERFPLGMAWTRETATPNDVFVTGDSGAGYVNPYHLSEPRQFSGLPSGWEAWEKHCKKFMEQWDLSAVGFVLDGHTPVMKEEGFDAYSRFAPDGIVLHRPRDGQRQGVHNGMPFVALNDGVPHDVMKAGEKIARSFRPGGPRFFVFRSVLRSPSWYVELEDRIASAAAETGIEGLQWQLVDMRTLFWLVEAYETGESKPVILDETPAENSARPGQFEGLYPVSVPDGPYSVVDDDGVPCWRLPPEKVNTYFYFDIEDLFAAGLDVAVEVSISYLDAGSGRLQLHYDSTDSAWPGGGAYKTAEPANVERQGTGTWKTLRFQIGDGRFANRQNNLSDLRIWSQGDALLVREVRVKKLEPAGAIGP